ncbi:glyoxalase [Mycobacterium saskatchewanense]|uniref:VOC family protein n=1 Tax=Mycobacterium saskatchewanense TaxID=220927 RepID=UPI00114EA030|nr:VOC family protein [Mycobacterium saskatchewanense]BBX62597.1 glyoxalase [Mycobacterium saskatchewanense]
MTGVPARLNVVVLGVRDIDTMRGFYESLGWRPRPRRGAFSRMDLAGASLMLFPLDVLLEVVGLPLSENGFRGTVNAIVAEDDDMARSILSAAVAAGGTRLSELTQRNWGVRTGYFADPERNVWEVAVLPGASFDDSGALIWPTQ